MATNQTITGTSRDLRSSAFPVTFCLTLGANRESHAWIGVLAVGLAVKTVGNVLILYKLLSSG